MRRRSVVPGRRESRVQHAHTGMDLRVAIRAQHHAVFELLLDLLPAPIDAVDGDREFFLAWVGVMELKSRWRVRGTACQAHPAERCDRTAFVLPTQLYYPVARNRNLPCVADPVAVCAHQVAFGRFCDQPRETSAEVPEAKVFRKRIAVMKLQSLGTDRVTAVDTLAAVSRHEIGLALTAPLAKRAAELLPPPA